MGEDRKIRKISAVDQVFDKLREDIEAGVWKVGEKIPTETELSEELGVNRLTVRNALQRLYALGIVEIRVGDGTYVRQFDMVRLIEKTSGFLAEGQAMSEVSEYREAVEPAAVRLACERRTEEQLEDFRELCGRFEEEVRMIYESGPNAPEVEKWFMKSVDTSLDLHRAIFNMSGNQLLVYGFTLCEEPVRRHMQYNASHRLNDLEGDRENRWVGVWRGVCRALEERDGAAAGKLLGRLIHLDGEA